MGADPISGGIGAAMGLASSIAQMVKGAKQAKEGRKEMKGLVRPNYQRPEEIDQLNRMTALRAANPELAGQRQMEESVGQSTASALNAAKDFGSSNDIYKAQINENNAMAGIGIQAAQQRLASEAQRLNALNTMADYTDKEFDYNQNIPYQEDRKSAMSKIAAGEQNINTGLNTMGSMGASMMGSGMFGKGGEAAAPAATGGGGSGLNNALQGSKSLFSSSSPSSKVNFGSFMSNSQKSGLGLFQPKLFN
jgi:hypothetical protein